ncbi:E3 ubiquitin-protein ligase PDZRN3 [Denticeps clupeoides]|uniref:Uncharacterized protein n=1 Tax=Denticeps clupeoides TaxID=299321 RepID=A0AAY4C2D8_9TELE|nr:E3 ubiquitin-protein ligase PDZRN3-like [Denticeps clupeoides]
MGCRLSGPWFGDGMGVHGRDLSHLSKREALRVLASYEQPIMMQMDGRRGRSLQLHRTSDCSTQTERPWDPLRGLGCGMASGAPRTDTYLDRHCCNHVTLPGEHRDGNRYEFLPNAPRDVEDVEPAGRQDPELSRGGPPGQNCLIGCCNANLEEPSSFQSQTEDEDFVQEKQVGYLPLHHELDSGLGWTDGSFHQGELSGVETEEGLEDYHAPVGGGGSPSSESFISSELSDSGFYSVGTGEFLRFQRLLEKRMRLYNARMHHQGEMCARDCRETQKTHRELEAIPEALTVQPQNRFSPAVGVPGEASRGLFRVSSVQFRKAERPNLNRHSCSSGSLFNPQANLSTCSTPSGQRRPPTHQGSSAGMLRRSRTLHHRPPPMEYRRRASHPSSPNYCSTTPHHCAERVLPSQLPAHPRASPGQECRFPAHGGAYAEEYRPDSRPERSFITELPHRDARFHTLGHPPAQSQDIHETWPKPASRTGPGGGGGLYSTLEAHLPTSGSRKPAPPPPPGSSRAVRNQLLRDRASRLADERSGMSTDEESEARMGRYWTRTERREHVQARQQQQQLQARGGAGGRGCCAGGAGNTVLELSQKKLSRLRNRKLLDDWTTVEELLTHGTRVSHADDVLCSSSLLTVTTV